MEPVPIVPPDSILEEESQCSLSRALASALTPTPDPTPASPQSSSLVAAGTDLLHKVENIPTRFEPAPQTGHSMFKQQLFCSYEIHKLNVDTTVTPSSPPAAEMFRGAFDYLQSNQPVAYSHFPCFVSPFQGPMLNPPIRDFPPAACPKPWNCHSFPSPGTVVFGGLPPMHFEPMAPGNSCMVNMGYLPPFNFGSGPCMVINMPEFCQGVCLPPPQMFFTPEGFPSWCMSLPLAAFYQTCRPVLVYSRKDNMLLNGTQTSEDWRKEKEEHKVFPPDKTMEQGRRVSSKPLAAFQDQLQMGWSWEDSGDVPTAICPKSEENETPEISSFMDCQDDLATDTNSVRNLDMDGINCLFPSDMNTFDFTLEDLQSLMEESLDTPLNEKSTEETPPPPSEIERIIQYMLSDAPLTHPQYERKLYKNKLDLIAQEEPKKNLGGFSASQQSPVVEKLMYPNMSFPLDSYFEDLPCKNSREVNNDHRKRHGERDSKKHFLKTEMQSREAARKKGVLNASKSNFCTDIRWSHRASDHTKELDRDGYPFRGGERKPADKFHEMANQEHRKFMGKWQESRVPQGKPLDFFRRMEMSSEWLHSIEEEPREEERGETSKVVRRKPQSKKTDRLKPAPKKTKPSTSKKAAEVSEYEDSGEPLLPRSLMKRGKARDTKHKTTQPAKASRKTKAEDYEPYFPPTLSVKSKNNTTAGKCSQKAKCPSKRMKTLPSVKTAEGRPESDGFLYPALSEVQKQQCTALRGGKTKKQKVSQRRGLKIKPEGIKEEADEEEELEELWSTAKKRQQRSNTPKKRKGAADETPEMLCFGPVKKYRDSEQRGPRIRIKRERGTLRATWLHIE